VSPALRTKLLGAVAAGAVLYAVVDAVQAPGASTISTAPGDVAATGSAVVVLAGAPRDLDRKALAERYRPIRSAQPFKPRSFDPPPPPRRSAPDRREPALGEKRQLAAPPPPDKIDVRLTGFLGRGEARRAVLEETNSSGKGLVVTAGLSLGPVSVAAVGTDSITFTFTGEDDAQKKDLALGSSIELPKAVSSKLETLKVTSGDVAAVTTTGGSSAASGGDTSSAPVSAEDRQAVLERLRERRRRSIQGGGE
jgi:hypothetical protein